MTGKELRELDAYLAEHVMGYKRRGDEICLPWDDGGMLSGVKWCGLSMIQRYTTDPAAAFAVLEKCRCVGSVHIMPPSPDHNSEIWGCGVRAAGDTLALTICLFAKQLFSENQTPDRTETAR